MTTSVQLTITSRASGVLIGLMVVLANSACESHPPVQPEVKISRARLPVPGQFMTLSEDGTHLVNTITNKPVFMTGDAPQLLMVQVSDADVETYLADRAARKFNVLWVYPVDAVDQSNAPKNFYGDVPFRGADFTNENEKYWAHVDFVVQRAEAHGITLLMNPAFVGLDASGGYIQSYRDSSDAVITTYGQWIGNRYKNYPNIIWSIGGDSNTPNIKRLKQKMSDLATGIASADPNHLITSEECPVGVCGVGSNSTLDIWDGASWVGLNGNYAQYGQVQSQCAAQYAKLTTYPKVPPFQTEDWYEGEHSMTELQLREEAYWEVLSGCYLGRFFGNNAIWTMGGKKDTMGQTWQSQLGSTGSLGQQHLGQLMRSREHWLMVPDLNNTVLTEGFGSGATISVAARSSDGHTIIAYVPNGNATAITVDLAKITSKKHQAKCWWFNPRSGAATLIGIFPNVGSRKFTPPDSDDWVLVVDDSSAHLLPPGNSDL
jgi:hypothetical protein